MSYKPEETTMMAYLYGELDAEQKEKFENYLLVNPEVNKQLDSLRALRSMMASVGDKEVIAPPIFVGEAQHNFWNSSYLKSIVGIAASLLIVLFVGKIFDIRMSYSKGEFTLGFGNSPAASGTPSAATTQSLTANDVQAMINSSLLQNNSEMQTNWMASQKKLDVSIQKNLALNSKKIDQLVLKASTASQQQIQSFVANMQNDNMKLVKDYFQLTSADQKKYIEDMLIDFAKYMQQQQNNNMQVVETRLNSLEKNTDVFKQETEQILSSIITQGANTRSKGIRN